MERQILSVREIKELLPPMSKDTLYRIVNRADFPKKRVGKMIFINKADFDKWMRSDYAI